MSGWNDDYGWDDEPSAFSRLGGVWLLVFFAGMIFSCLLLLLFLRWPATASFLAPIFTGESTQLVATVQPVALETPESAVVTLTAVQTLEAPKAVVAASNATQAVVTTVPEITSTSTPTAEPTVEVTDFNPAQLKSYMLELINQDRMENGLLPVAWDETAELAGQLHVDDMLEQSYFSHWNMEGDGPEHRYAKVGGQDVVSENNHSFQFRFSDGRPAPIQDWYERIEEAQAGLMNSPGHRRNILDPHRTHVGVGLGYDAEKGEFRLAQEFINHLVEMEPVPQQIALGDTVTIAGRLLPGSSNPLVNLTYEPLRAPMTVDELPTGSYSSDAEIYQALGPTVQGDRFTKDIQLDHEGRPGIYTIRVWVDHNRESVLATELIVWVD